MSEQEHIYTQPKPSDKLLRKLTVSLAVVTFVVAVIVATFYKPLSSTPNAISESFEYKQFQTQDEFFTYLENSGISTKPRDERITFSGAMKPISTETISDGVFFGLSDNQIVRVNTEDDISIQSEVFQGQDALGIALAGNTLALQQSDSIVGLKQADFTTLWEINFSEGILLHTFTNGVYFYAITASPISQATVCPLPFATEGGITITTPCAYSFHPNRTTDVNTLYTIVAIDPGNGGVIKRISFVGDSGGTQFEAHDTKIQFVSILPYDNPEDVYNLITTEGKDLLPTEIVLRAQELSTYDISAQSRLYELKKEIYKYQNSLTEKQKAVFATNLTNLLSKTSTSTPKRATAEVNLETFEVDNSVLTTNPDPQQQVEMATLSQAGQELILGSGTASIVVETSSNEKEATLTSLNSFFLVTTSRASYLYLLSGDTFELRAFYTATRNAKLIPTDDGVAVVTADSVTIINSSGVITKTFSLKVSS